METSPLLVFAGAATEDSIVVVKEMPGADERVIAEEIVFEGGGPAATAAVEAARLGVSAAVVATVGDDEAGDLVRERLRNEGVDVSGVQTIQGGRTSRSVVVVSGPDRARSIMNQPGPPLDLDSHRTGVGLIDAAQWVHVDQHGWTDVYRHLARASGLERGGHHTSPGLSIDAGNPIPGLQLLGAELYAPTLASIRSRYGMHYSVGELIDLALDEGVGRVVVTDGGAGAYAAENLGEVVRAEAPVAEIHSTLGAGDVFHGALLAADVHARSGSLAPGLESLVNYATTVATLSCRGLDGRSRIPNHEETLRHLPCRTID